MENLISPAHGWLIASLTLIAIEVLGASGVGFLFAGIAAMTVAIMVHYDVINAQDWLAQLGIFGGLSAFIALLLWRKLKHWRSGHNSKAQYANMIGDMATVGKGGLEKGAIGQVSWSGTTMMAQIDPKESAAAIHEGAMVTITAVKGNQLFVAQQAA